MLILSEAACAANSNSATFDCTGTPALKYTNLGVPLISSTAPNSYILDDGWLRGVLERLGLFNRRMCRLVQVTEVAAASPKVSERYVRSSPSIEESDERSRIK
jgi:hypothetical protein